MKQVGARAGFEPVFVPVRNGEDAERALREGTVDFVPGIGITEKRAQEFAFSAYIETVPVSLFVRSSEHRIHTLDDATEQYFIAHPEESYVLSAGRTRDVYAAAFPEMERLYRAAQAKITDPQSARRLEMLGTNLTVLHWNLRQMKLLAEPEKSSFYLADADFFSLVLASRKSLALAPTAGGARPASLRKNLSVSPGAIAGAEQAQPFLLRGDQHILLKPISADPIRVTFSSVTSRGKLLTYSVYDPEGGEVAVGLVSAGATMELPGSKSAYYHLQISAGSATFSMAVDGACWAVDQSAGEQGLHFLGKVPPLYFEAVSYTHLTLPTIYPV